MSKVEQVQAMLRPGRIVECIENTYIPDRGGTRRTLLKVGKSVADCEMDGKPYRMNLPTRQCDVLAVGEDTFTMALGGYKAPPRLAGHIASYRVVDP